MPARPADMPARVPLKRGGVDLPLSPHAPAKEPVNELGPEGRENIAPALRPGYKFVTRTAPEARKSHVRPLLRPAGAVTLLF